MIDQVEAAGGCCVDCCCCDVGALGLDGGVLPLSLVLGGVEVGAAAVSGAKGGAAVLAAEGGAAVLGAEGGVAVLGLKVELQGWVLKVELKLLGVELCSAAIGPTLPLSW